MFILTDENFQREVAESKGNCLVEFYASWCSLCRKGLNDLSEFERQTGCRTGKADLQKNAKLLNEFISNGLPHYVFFCDGKPVKRFTGITDLAVQFGEFL